MASFFDKLRKKAEDIASGKWNGNSIPTQLVKNAQTIGKAAVTYVPAARAVASVAKPTYNTAMKTPLGRADRAVAQGLARSAVGTAQSVSGLTDLATPGKGTSQFSKDATQWAKRIDAAAKTTKSNPLLYKGGQLAGDVLTAAAGGGIAKGALAGASKVPLVSKAVSGATKANNAVTRGVLNKTAPLAQKGFTGRVAARTIQNVANPKYQAVNALYTAQQVGKDAAQGRKITPASVGTNLAVGGIGIPAAGAVAGEAGRAAFNKVAPVAAKVTQGKRTEFYPGTQLKFDNKKNTLNFTPQQAAEATLLNVKDNSKELAGTVKAYNAAAGQGGAAMVSDNGNVLPTFNPKKSVDTIAALKQQADMWRTQANMSDTAEGAASAERKLAEIETKIKIATAGQGGYIRVTNGDSGKPLAPRQKKVSPASTKMKTQKNPGLTPTNTSLNAPVSKNTTPEQMLLQQAQKQQSAPQANKSLVPSNDIIPQIKQRGFTSSVKGSPEVSSPVQKAVSGEYQTRNTSDLAMAADKYSRGSIKKVTNEVNSSLDKKLGTLNDTEIANAMAVAKQHDAKGNYDQAQQIYDKLAEHGTKQGQAIQAFSLLRNRTPEGMKFQAVRTLKKAGVTLKPAEQEQLGALINAVKSSTGDARDKAAFKVFDFVSRKIPTSMGNKLVNFWRAGLLTAPKTTGGNILGNLTEMTTRDLWANPVAAGVDTLFSAFTGKRTKTLAGGQLKGLGEGIGKGKEYFMTGYDPRRAPNQKLDAPSRINYKNPILDKYVNGVYRLMGSQDQPFYYAAQKQAARDLATADAKNLKLVGRAREEYIAMAENTPGWKPQTFESKSNATNAAEYAVYQNETALGQAAGSLKSGLKKRSEAAGAVADFLLPFTQVPASVAMRIIDRTPLGVAKEIVSQIKSGKFDQRAMSEAIGNGSFGIGVFAAGTTLAKSGSITGAYPTDNKERKLWDSEGKKAYSVKIGNRWYGLNYMQPFGTILSMGAQFHKNQKDGMSSEEAWNAVGASALKSVESQSFLQGLNGVISAINDPQRSMSQYTTSTASSIVPNFIRGAARASDPLQRETKGVAAGFKGAVPGLRQTLPAKQDMFGNPLPAQDNFANQYINPLSPSKIRNTNDPLVKELRRLQDADNGIVTTEFNKGSIKGVTLDDAQVREVNKTINNEVQSVWSNVISDSRYSSLGDEDKATLLKKVKDTIGTAFKNGLSANLGGTAYPTDAQRRILNNVYPDWFELSSKSTKTATKSSAKKTSTKKSSGSKVSAPNFKNLGTSNLVDTRVSQVKYAPVKKPTFKQTAKAKTKLKAL